MADYRRARAMETALRRAVAEGSLRVWYQPIWSAEEKRSVAAEALLRIDAEDFRGVSPEVYIPIAEQCGLIREIGSFVFEDVCRFLSQHAAETEALRYIELNLSVYQFLYDDVAARFEEIRARWGIPAARLNLEITESASDRTAPGMKETVERLRALGYTFSLDDFGTGYANLSRLIQREYMNVKIDKSLLWDADRSGDTRLLLDNVTRLLRALGYSIVQEGVETPAQLERATASGCNLIQGYYFSRPLPEDDFLRYLEAERRT
jgi:EAL domain-containing protein (putative c-di-GMP-specific phosphodiesterase class I)